MSQFSWELLSADLTFTLGAVLIFIPWGAQMCYLNFSIICTKGFDIPLAHKCKFQISGRARGEVRTSKHLHSF